MRLIRIKKTDSTLDSVVERKNLYGHKADPSLLVKFEALWNNLRDFRRARDRAMRFVYGDQWGDLITVNGKQMTQREYLSSVGNVALQSNQVKKVVSTITGAWVKQSSTPEAHSRVRKMQPLADILTILTQLNWERNDMPMIMSHEISDGIIGGMCALRETYERDEEGKDDAWSHIVSPNALFFDADMTDPRFKNISIVGELMDLTFNELCAAYAESPEDYEELRRIFINQASPSKMPDNIRVNDKTEEGALSFYDSRDTSKCRVICAWTKERRPRYHVHDEGKGELYDINADDTEAIKAIEAENKARAAQARKEGFDPEEVGMIHYKEYWFMDTFWYCRHLTSTGEILFESESDLPNRSHPYTICALPCVNGKIVSHLHDAIDQNIAINRILTLDDWIRRSGAKGVTFVPQSIIPDGMDYKTFAEQWTSINGIVYYKPNNQGERPFTEYGNVGNLNTADLVRMMNELMQDSVSVSGAIQGKTPHAGTSAALYSQQKENSTTPMAPLLLDFETFFKGVSYKKAKFICQHYDAQRVYDICDGMPGINLQNVLLTDFDNLDFYFKIINGSDLPSLRMQSNDLLLQAVQMQMLGLGDAVELGEFPNGQAIAERLAARAAEMQQRAEAEGQQVGPGYEQKKAMLSA